MLDQSITIRITKEERHKLLLLVEKYHLKGYSEMDASRLIRVLINEKLEKEFADNNKNE